MTGSLFLISPIEENILTKNRFFQKSTFIFSYHLQENSGWEFYKKIKTLKLDFVSVPGYIGYYCLYYVLNLGIVMPQAKSNIYRDIDSCRLIKPRIMYN